jgi:hypothetical protein
MKKHEVLFNSLQRKEDFKIGLELLFHATNYAFANRHKESPRLPRPTEPWPGGGFVEVNNMLFEAKLLASTHGYELKVESHVATFIKKIEK